MSRACCRCGLPSRVQNLIIAGGMGNRAQTLFAQQGIQVVTGAPADPPEQIVAGYIAGKLETGQNLCDH